MVSAISSAICLTLAFMPRQWRVPEMFMVQPASLQMTVLTPVWAMQVSLSSLNNATRGINGA